MDLTRWLLALALVPACTCGRRPHVAVSRDGGPVVVLLARRPIDAGAPGPALPPVELVVEQEPNDDVARAQPLEYPKGITGTLSAGSGAKPDVDVYRWLVGGETRLLARIELVGAPADATLDVLDRSGDPIGRAQPAEHVVPNLAVAPGDVWFLRVRGRSAAGSALRAGSTPSYRLIVSGRPLSPGDEVEPNDSATRASQLVAGVEQSGYFGRAHDEDWLRLPEGLAEGGTLRIELSPVDGVAASVRVRDGTGAQLAFAPGARGDELRLRNAPAPRGGLIVLRAESGKNVNVPWHLRFAGEAALSGSEVEPNDTHQSANPIDVPSTVGARAVLAGFLWRGDADVYRVRGASGLLDITLAPPPGIDVRLERLSEAGAVLDKVDQGGPGLVERMRAVMVAPSRPGTGGAPGEGAVWLRVVGRPGDVAFDAPYALAVLLSSESAPDGGDGVR